MGKKEFSILQAKEVLAPYLPYDLKVGFRLKDDHSCLFLVKYSDAKDTCLNGEILDCINCFESITPELTPLKKLHKFENKVWLNQRGYLVDSTSLDILINYIEKGKAQHCLVQELIKRKFDVFGLSKGIKIVL